ncbi:unnamed protein product [Rhizophagus irregularis]|nr:unnamed protein product [Rhizophagus irregularis]
MIFGLFLERFSVSFRTVSAFWLSVSFRTIFGLLLAWVLILDFCFALIGFGFWSLGFVGFQLQLDRISLAIPTLGVINTELHFGLFSCYCCKG